MQDRFKFRVWSNKQKKMYYWSDIIKIPNFGYALFVDNRALGEGLWIKQQSTGLKDKNGKLIYEGDILGGIYENLYIHWCNDCKQFQLKAQDYGCIACEGDIHWADVVEDNNKLEVIGNIYENPELLEVENERN